MCIKRVTVRTLCIFLAAVLAGVAATSGHTATGQPEIPQTTNICPEIQSVYLAGNSMFDPEVVGCPLPPEISLSADPTNIPYGGSSTVHWTSANATSCQSNTGVTGLSGSFSTGALYSTTTYNVSCGNGVTSPVTASVTIYVAAPGAPPPTPACSDGVDNDSDGKVDMADPGCTDPSDNDEADPVPTAPFVSDISPTSGPIGTSVTINGGNFYHIQTVSLCFVYAQFTVISSSQVIAYVPQGACSGAWRVSNAGGTGTSGTFTVTSGQQAPPTISSISPTSGPPGSAVSVNGNNFVPGGTTGTICGIAAGVGVNSMTSVSMTVPSNASCTNGQITLSTSSGSASYCCFTATAPPPPPPPPPAAAPVVNSFSFNPTARWSDDPPSTGSWNCSNTSSASITSNVSGGGSWSSQPAVGSVSAAPPPGTTTYTLKCSGPGGVATASTQLGVADASSYQGGQTAGLAYDTMLSFNAFTNVQCKSHYHEEDWASKFGGIKLRVWHNIRWCFNVVTKKLTCGPQACPVYRTMGHSDPGIPWGWDSWNYGSCATTTCTDQNQLWNGASSARTWMKGTMRAGVSIGANGISIQLYRHASLLVGTTVFGDSTHFDFYN